MNLEMVKIIKERQKKLSKAKINLKKHFVGIDHIIDRIAKDIETWYVMPELLSRPAIVCLWGPTGVGKTDLVRRLVKELGVQNRFCELTISNKGCPSYPWSDNIGSILRNSNVESGSPSVILLDEIQGFRTVDEEDCDIHDCKFKDVWTLLSDGKLPYKVEVDSLMGMLWELQKKEDLAFNQQKTPIKSSKKIKTITDVEDIQAIIDDDDDDEEDGKSFYSLTHFKSVLRLDESIEDIATWNDAQKKHAILKRLNDKTIFEEEDYTKCLIFISGNLDEAYGFAKDVNEVDADADILHEMSKKINVLDIKEALTKRFKPEQISRMGNGHIIYPSLSRLSFETIIDRKIEEIQKKVEKQTGVSVEVSSSIKTLIYDNGVFPTQGTRPLFSTISDIIENSLPNFLLKAIMKDVTNMTIDYDGSNIIAKFNDVILKRHYVGDLDKLKNDRRNNIDRKTLTAVHEAGHAVAFAILFGMAPSQIVSTPASSETEGFIYTVQSCQSKEMVMKRLSVMLAGQAAEKIFFGSKNVTSGSGNDLHKATEKAAMIIRKWGMGSYSSVIRSDNDLANNDIKGSNNLIENIVKEGIDKAEEILNRNIVLLQKVIDRLLVVDKITPHEFKVICQENGLNIGESISSEEVIYWGYHQAYEEFKGKKIS